MLEKAFTGGKGYLALVLVACAVLVAGFLFYLEQLETGLAVTGLGRDVSWGFYIAQFTFLVGVAASAVTVVLPYYLHDFKAFARMTILGEFLAIPAVVMCILFIFVDLGQPSRIFSMFLHPSPTSLMFWDTVALLGYLFLNLVIGWTTLDAERNDVPPPSWVRPLVYLSIPWAISIHTVTAFLYAGLPGRHLWLTAILAARFLASAFSSGGALLVLLCLVMRRFTSFDAGRGPIAALARIVAYALAAHLFFLGLEFFTALYSGIPSYRASLEHLFFNFGSGGALTVLTWVSTALALASLVMLLSPGLRGRSGVLALSAAGIFISIWIEKGFGLVVGGFIPTPLEKIVIYTPTLTEVFIGLGVWSAGILILSMLYRITIAVRKSA